MTDAPPIRGVLEAALYAEDLQAAKRFWTEIIVLSLIAEVPGRHIFLDLGDAVLLVFNPVATLVPPAPDARLPVPPHGTSGAGHFCLAVAAEALPAWRDHLSARGVAIEADFEWPQGGSSIYFRDPAGNSIELATPNIWNKTK